jgi:hypothetical protein
MTFLFGFIAGFWACLLLLLSPWGKLHRSAPTKHNRRYRDAPERNLSREIQAGMAELNRRDADMAEVGGIEYRFLGATGEEQ